MRSDRNKPRESTPQRRDGITEQYPISPHARQRLAERWPDTLLRPKRFDNIAVPRNAPLVGYDSATGAQFVIVPETPMVAVVLGEVVTSFLTQQLAEAKIALHGYGAEGFYLNLPTMPRAEGRGEPKPRR